MTAPESKQSDVGSRSASLQSSAAIAAPPDLDVSQPIGASPVQAVNNSAGYQLVVVTLPGSAPQVSVVAPGALYTLPACPASQRMCTYDIAPSDANGMTTGMPDHRVVINGSDSTPGDSKTTYSYDSNTAMPRGYTSAGESVTYTNTTGRSVLVTGTVDGAPFSALLDNGKAVNLPACGVRGCSLITGYPSSDVSQIGTQLSVLQYSNGAVRSTGTESGGGGFAPSGSGVRYTNRSAAPQVVRYVRDDGDERVAVIAPGQAIVLPPCLGATARCEYNAVADRLVITNAVGGAADPQTTTPSLPVVTTPPMSTTATQSGPGAVSSPRSSTTPRPTTTTKKPSPSRPKPGNFDFTNALQAVGPQLAELKKIDPKSWAAAMHVSPEVAQLIVKVAELALSLYDVATSSGELGTGHGRVSTVLTFISGIFGTVAGLLPFFVPQTAVVRLAFAGLSLAFTAMAIGLKGTTLDKCLGKSC